MENPPLSDLSDQSLVYRAEKEVGGYTPHRPYGYIPTNIFGGVGQALDYQTPAAVYFDSYV